MKTIWFCQRVTPKLAICFAVLSAVILISYYWIFYDFPDAELPHPATGDDLQKLHYGEDKGLENVPCRKPCSLATRRRLLREQCRLSPPPTGNARRTELRLTAANVNNHTLTLGSAWVDPERRIVGCLMPKVSSTTWVQYLMTHATNNWKFEPVPVSDLVHGKYSTWTKFVVVRHPLQRLISAYFEVMVRRQPYSGLAFEEFAEKLVSREIYDWNPHWSTYTSWCYPCHVDYDVIIRVETIERDLPLFNKAAGIPMNATLPIANLNKDFNNTQRRNECILENLFRYDSFMSDFHRKHPEIMLGLLNIYKYDMSLLGYDWHKSEHSNCVYNNGGNVCC